MVHYPGLKYLTKKKAVSQTINIKHESLYLSYNIEINFIGRISLHAEGKMWSRKDSIL